MTTIDPTIEARLIKYQDKGYVFKSCEFVWIVVLEKTSDTITNETRSMVEDPRYAKFRGNEFKVIDIVHKFDPNKTTDVCSSIFRSITTPYKIGDIVKADHFDDYLDKIYYHGIHFFNHYEAAMSYERYISNGILREWWDNGEFKRDLLYDDNYLINILS
jgi:hypothetical protein